MRSLTKCMPTDAFIFTKVFAAWTRPETLARWFGPVECTSIEARIDLKVGGRYPMDDGHIVVGQNISEDAERAFRAEGNDLEGIHGWVADSGEGRWTVAEAIDHDVPAPVITLSLIERFRSRREPDSYTDRVLAALRNEFGGHAIKDRR